MNKFSSLPHERLVSWYESAKPSERRWHPDGEQPSGVTERQIKAEIDAYGNEPTRERLIRIHDLLERHRFESEHEHHINPDFISMGGSIQGHLVSEGLLDQVRRRAGEINPKQLFMWQDDLDHLVRQAMSKEGEIGGGAKFVNTGNKGIRIQPIYSSPHKMRSCSVPIYLEPFLSSNADLIWHTHPRGVTHTLSWSDIESSKSSGVPIMVAGITPEGKPATEIHFGNKVYPVRAVRRPFSWLFSLFKKMTSRLG